MNGPCLDESDLIKCVFDDQESPEDGIYIADTLALCIVPVLPKSGYIPFQLSVERTEGMISTYSSTFTACNYSKRRKEGSLSIDNVLKGSFPIATYVASYSGLHYY